MAHFLPPDRVGPSKVSLWEPTLGRLELGDLPFVVESFQIGSPSIRDNVKNRAHADGEFDDTLYHGASAITVSTRLGSRTNCGSDYGMAQLRDTLIAYAHPRRRPRLYWRYPGDPGPSDDPYGDGAGQWATVRGASWPFVVNGPKYPVLVVQFRNPLGQMFLGDLEASPHSATAFSGDEPGGRVYTPTTHYVTAPERNYPNVTSPAGTAIIHNNGNGYADWVMTVNGPFDAGAFVVLAGVTIEFNDALLVNEHVTLNSRNKTVMHSNGLSYYPNTNFGDWSWEQVQLPHGNVYMTFTGEDGGNPSGWATIEWYSTSI